MENNHSHDTPRSERLVTVDAKHGGICYMVVDFNVHDDNYRFFRRLHGELQRGEITEADVEGIEVPCFAAGGGFKYRYPLSKIRSFDAVIPTDLVRAVFGFDTAYENPEALHFVGYHNPHRRWNGWAVPYLPVESAEAFVRAWEKEFGDHARKYPDDAVFVEYRDGKLHFDERSWGADGLYTIEPETVRIDGQLRQAFNLGGSYTWNDFSFAEWEKIHTPCVSCGSLKKEAVLGSDKKGEWKKCAKCGQIVPGSLIIYN